jgi:PASTA domain-containing protein
VLAAAVSLFVGCGGGEGGSTPGLTGPALKQLAAAARSERQAREVSKATVRVPPIAGEPYVDGRHQLARAGLRFSGRYPGTEGNPDLPTRCLVVTSQSPAAGTEVPKGSEVVGTIGVCPDRIPSLSSRSRYEP